MAQWLGPKRDGSTGEKVTPWKDDQPPKVLWPQEISAGYSSPVIAGGKVFVHAVVRDKDEEEVIAYDLVKGDVLWKDSYVRPRFRSILGTGPRATPTASGKQLFTMGINGVLSCYDTETANLPGRSICSASWKRRCRNTPCAARRSWSATELS